jgi:hypothetical protein
MHTDFWICSDFPTVIRKDEFNRPHSEVGPTIAWSDGFEVYSWRGVTVPKEWIMNKASIDPKLALTDHSIDRRRVVGELVGWGRVLEAVESKLIDKDQDPEIGELIQCKLTDNDNARFLRVQCGTGRVFCLPVPGEMTTALEANAWTYGLNGDMLRKLEVRT